MSKFIRLTDEDGFDFAVNLQHAVDICRDPHGGTRLYMVGSRDYRWVAQEFLEVMDMIFKEA